MARSALIVPTLDGGALFQNLLESLRRQTLQPDERILLDSESADDTVSLAQQQGFDVCTILRNSFDHGGTRQIGVQSSYGDIIVFMTQDAVLAEDTALARLLAVFADPTIGAAYGRQLPWPAAGLLEYHARLFNYPLQSRTVSLADAPKLGIKAAFLSDSFAAYRRSALLSVGGFPHRIILGEDMAVGAKLLLAGWRIQYCAEAAVYHSHPYSAWQEFQRYFDTGVMHSQENWLMQQFGGATGEGRRFVRSEWSFLFEKKAAFDMLSAIWRNGLKYMGYQLGRREQVLPLGIKRHCSMNQSFWDMPK